MPANVSKFSRVVARAQTRKMKVVKEKEVTNLNTFVDVLSSGKMQAILNFMEEKDIEDYKTGFFF